MLHTLNLRIFTTFCCNVRNAVSPLHGYARILHFHATHWRITTSNPVGISDGEREEANGKHYAQAIWMGRTTTRELAPSFAE
jgi:hypothetical protein